MSSATPRADSPPGSVDPGVGLGRAAIGGGERLRRVLLECPPRSGLARLAAAESGFGAWKEPIAGPLARWARGEASAVDRAAFPISAGEISSWCLDLLEECERLAAASSATSFSTLELDPADATAAKAREQFRKLSLASHPDRHPEEERPRWLQRQVELNLAYESLKTDVAFDRERAAAVEVAGLARHFGLDRMAPEELAGAAARARRWREAAPHPSSDAPSMGQYSPEKIRLRRRAKQAVAFGALAVGVAYAAWRGGEAMDLGGRSRGGPLPSSRPASAAASLVEGGASDPAREVPAAVGGSATPGGPSGAANEPPRLERDPFDLSASPALTLTPAPAHTPAELALWTPAPIAPTPRLAAEHRRPDAGGIGAVGSVPPAARATPTPRPTPAPTPRVASAPRDPDGRGVDLAGLESAEVLRRVDEFLRAYARAYEREDLDRLGDLFLGDVLQNGEDGRDAIMERYGRFFARAERVSMKARRASCREIAAGGDVEARFIYKLEYRLPPTGNGKAGEARSQEGEATLRLRPTPAAPGGFAIARIDFIAMGSASEGR